jgi:hypothetical protein
MRTPRSAVTALLAASLACGAAHAGAYLESVEKDLDGSKTPATSKMWFDSGRMRTERTERDGDVQLVLFKNQAMYMLDSKTKTYRVIDKSTAEQMSAQLANAKKQMEARMAAMPPEQRKKMEEMMAKLGKGGAAGMMPGAPKPPQRTLKNSGRSETVAGIKCTIWEAYEDGKKDEELCAAAPGALPGGDDVMKTFRDISTMMSSFTESLGSGRADNQPWHDMDKINGVPILTRDFDDGKPTSEMRMTVVRKESVPGASFEVPAGYTAKKLDINPGSHHDED